MGGDKRRKEGILKKILGIRRKKRGSSQYWSRPAVGALRDYPGLGLCMKCSAIVCLYESSTTT